MPIIQKLPPHEAQKIAAGEVVERPANIIKELIENSLDAEATQINIYLEQAGKKSIRIQDNGCGMDAQDARACFEHHATSKIKHVDDLQTISTFGFRGEALSSIASVSTVVLITKQANATEGVQITIKNGTLINQCTVSATIGTDIIITDLFNNVPARKKFLKTKETEWRQIQNLFFAIALDYINLSFKLYSEQKLLFNCPTTDSLQSRWAQLIDHETSAHLIVLKNQTSQNDSNITGVISNPQYGRYDKSHIYFFVNNRWIKDYKLNRIFINGYQNVLPTHQFPMGCIKITIDPSLIDVNIHPRKEEVQFLHPNKLYDAIKQAITYTLESYVSDQFGSYNPATITPKLPSDFPSSPPQPIITQSKPYSSASFDFDTFFNMPFNTAINISQSKMELINDSSHASESLHMNAPLPQDALQHEPYTIIGTYHKTYILIEQDSALLFIDQHAAHERVLYEQFKNSQTPATIQLLFPYTLTFTKDDIALLMPHLESLCIYGIEAELFSETQIIIKATPVQLKNASFAEIIGNCIAVLHQEKNGSPEQIKQEFEKKLHADMACKAAVKAGDVLEITQIQQLITDLMKTDNRFLCPHGRPTSWQLPLDMIKKKFKRDYR